MIYGAYNLVSTGNMLGIPLGAFGSMYIVAGCGIQTMKNTVTKEYKTYKKEMTARGLK